MPQRRYPRGSTPTGANGSAAADRAGGLVTRHAPGRVAAPLVFVQASDNQDTDLKATLRSAAAGPVHVEPLAAGHDALLSPETVATLADAINRHLR